MHNLHISLTEFRNESRVLKETTSLLKYNIFKSVTIISLHAADLPEQEVLATNCKLFRLRIKSRNLPAFFLFQFLKYFEFCIRVIFLSIGQRPNVVNIHSITLLPIGVLLKVLFRAHLIYDTHELETEVEGLVSTHKKLFKLLEYTCIRFASLVITVSPMIGNWYRESYQLENVIVVLNSLQLQDSSRPGRLRKQLGIMPEQIICLYQGALCYGRGIELLLETFRNLDSDNFVLVFMGYGQLECIIKKAQAKSSRIYYLPAVHPSLILEYTVDADIGLALIENCCLSYYLCLPNKLFEYTMARVPVVCSPMPEMASLVQEYKIGALLNDFSTTSVLRALYEVKSLEFDKMQSRLDQFNRYFCWEEQEKILINAYQKFILNAV